MRRLAVDGASNTASPTYGWRPRSGSPLVIALAGDATITASAAATSAMRSRLNAYTPC